MLCKQKNEIYLYVYIECLCQYRILSLSLFIKEKLLII